MISSRPQMISSVFCLVPAGDSIITDRLYTSMAAGCIPVVIAEPLPGAFKAEARYEEYWVAVSPRTFNRDTTQLIKQLREMPPHEIARRQQARRRGAGCVAPKIASFSPVELLTANA